MHEPWILTIGGRDHALSGKEASMQLIDIYDIAHALSIQNRFTGHTKRPYSVAEHSLLVADMLQAAGFGAGIQLAGLMHDAHEAYTSDVSSPAKQVLGLAWRSFEAMHAERVRRHFDLEAAFFLFGDIIGRFDLVALATERRDLTSWEVGRNLPWLVIDTPGGTVPPCDRSRLMTAEREARQWSDWKAQFLERYFQLHKACLSRAVPQGLPAQEQQHASAPAVPASTV